MGTSRKWCNIQTELDNAGTSRNTPRGGKFTTEEKGVTRLRLQGEKCRRHTGLEKERYSTCSGERVHQMEKPERLRSPLRKGTA